MVLEFFQSGFWEELWQREPSWKLPLGRWCPWPNSPFLSPVHLCSFHSLQRMQKITVRTISTQSRYNSIVIKVQNSSRKQENGLFANLHFCVFNFIVRGLKMISFTAYVTVQHLHEFPMTVGQNDFLYPLTTTVHPNGTLTIYNGQRSSLGSFLTVSKHT